MPSYNFNKWEKFDLIFEAVVWMTVVKHRARVIKASGDTEVFDPNVITNECIEAGIEFWTATEVALEVSKQIFDGISTKDIQKTTLEMLYKKNPEAAERYHRFHSMHVRTSLNTIEPFDRKKIVISLMTETRIPQEIARNVAKEAEEEIRRLKLDFVSGPLIREVVNVKLLEHGFEEARTDYTRLGMPVYDATQLIDPKGNMDLRLNPEMIHKLMADNVFKEYALLKAIPLHLADAHMNGDLHIHNLDSFVTRPHSTKHDLRPFLVHGLKVDGSQATSIAGPAKSAEVAVLHASKVLEAAQSNFSGGQTLLFFNVLLAPYIKGLEYERVKQIAQVFIYELSLMYGSYGGQKVMSEIEIEFGIPEALNNEKAVLPGGVFKKDLHYRNFRDEAILLARALMEIYLEGDYLGRPFKYPTPKVIIREEYQGKEWFNGLMVMAHELGLKSGNIFLLRKSDNNSRGILQSVTINLPRLAYEAGAKHEMFHQLLNEKMDMARDIIVIKRDIMKQRLEKGLMPFLSQMLGGKPYYDLESSFNCISFVGLDHMVKAVKGKHMDESKVSLKFGLEVIKEMKEITDKWTEESGLRWVVSENPNPQVAKRLAKLDYGKYQERAVLSGNLESGDVYYGDSYFLRDDIQISVFNKLETEGKFHPLMEGKVASVVSAQEIARDPKALEEFSRGIFESTQVKTLRFNKNNDGGNT